jgi:hypothetical protein
MISVWVLAGSALALALGAAWRTRRRRRLQQPIATSLPSVSEQWLSDRRIHRNDGQ